MERVGLDSIKEALELEENRLALQERIRTTLSLTTDPWKQIVNEPELRKNFEQLTQPETV
ncbi:hypothetical protein D3C81_2337000 [compost metagenome]